MSVALHGNLRDFGIGEVFQLIGQQRKSGILEVSGTNERIHVAFDGGAVVWAEVGGAYEHAAVCEMLVRVGLVTPDQLTEIEEQLTEGQEGFQRAVTTTAGLSAPEIGEIADLVTRDTIFALLRRTQGSFHFRNQSISHGRDPSKLLPAEQILMDGLRMVDEWRTLDDAATRPKTVFQRSGRFELYRSAHPEESPERLAVVERLFLLIDARLPVRRVVDLSRLGDFEAARLLSELRRVGAIDPMDEAALASARPAPRMPVHAPDGLARAVAVLPFVLLLVVGLAAARTGSGVGAEQGVAARLARSEARGLETRRLRHWAEAYSLARGAWPEGLAELEGFRDEALPTGTALTVSPGGSYYYARRDDGFVVLAPED